MTDHEQHPNVTEIDPAHALAYLNEGTTFTLAGEAFDTKSSSMTFDSIVEAWCRTSEWTPQECRVEAHGPEVFEASHCSVRPNDDLNDLAKTE
jgi:hypothetical protein